MIEFTSDIVKDTTIVTLEKEPKGVLLQKIKMFVLERNGEFANNRDHLNFILPRKLKTAHLQQVFDSRNIELLSKGAVKEKKFTSNEIDSYNKVKITKFQDEKETNDINIEDIYIEFGKFKGQKYIHCDEKYLKWIVDNHLAPNIRNYAQLALNKRQIVKISL